MNESDNRNNGSIHGNRDRKEDEDGGDVGREAAEKVAGLLERCKALQDAANTHSLRIRCDSMIFKASEAGQRRRRYKMFKLFFINSAQDGDQPEITDVVNKDWHFMDVVSSHIFAF
ncbi:hypothetical protein Mapa_018706 [Marchantia paleacea]|nr:hypothetical protein Mapa_018706 [Marchantia paleacea]